MSSTKEQKYSNPYTKDDPSLAFFYLRRQSQGKGRGVPVGVIAVRYMPVVNEPAHFRVSISRLNRTTRLVVSGEAPNMGRRWFSYERDTWDRKHGISAALGRLFEGESRKVLGQAEPQGPEWTRVYADAPPIRDVLRPLGVHLRKKGDLDLDGAERALHYVMKLVRERYTHGDERQASSGSVQD